uniref:MICOS complex subunit MIC60 n=1 Tax=Rhizochromulina marina TaxID=1034831 RepID=A0A7S2WP82_9STRA
MAGEEVAARVSPVDALHQELLKLEKKAQRNRAEALGDALSRIDAQDRQLKSELEQLILHRGELDKMDGAALRKNIIRLAAELNMRAKWEALRAKHLLEELEDEARSRHEETLRELHARHQSSLDAEILKVQDALAHQERMALQDLDAKATAELQNHLHAERDRLHAAVLAESQEELDKMKRQLEAEVKSKLTGYGQEVDSCQAETKVNGIGKQVGSLLGVVQDMASLGQHRQAVADLSAAILAVSDRLAQGEAIGKQVKSMGRMPAADDVIRATSAALLSLGADKGVPSFLQLRDQFPQVDSACRRALYTPEAVDGATGQLLGSFLSVFPRPPAFQDSDAPERKLDEIGRLLHRGDLPAAVQLAEGLGGPESRPLEDWLQDAKRRLAVEQTLQLLRAHGSVLNLRSRA